MSLAESGIFASVSPEPMKRTTHAQFHTRPDGKKIAHHGAVSSALHVLADREKPTEVVQLPNGTTIQLASIQPSLSRPDGYLSSYRAKYVITKGGKSETATGSEEATNLAVIVDAPTIKLTEADESEISKAKNADLMKLAKGLSDKAVAARAELSRRAGKHAKRG